MRGNEEALERRMKMCAERCRQRKVATLRRDAYFRRIAENEFVAIDDVDGIERLKRVYQQRAVEFVERGRAEQRAKRMETRPVSARPRSQSFYVSDNTECVDMEGVFSLYTMSK